MPKFVVNLAPSALDLQALLLGSCLCNNSASRNRKSFRKHTFPGGHTFRYATISSEKQPNRGPSTGLDADDSWPKTSHPNIAPTPYQILHHKRGEHYSKVRFYELVKIYHPDRAGHDCPSRHVASLPETIKMERYRLIVTAHEILSDPSKRSAYDRTGTGWLDRAGPSGFKYAWPSGTGGKSYGPESNDSPFRNATWEDWERWYQRQNPSHDGKPQTPQFGNNGGFLFFVITVVCFGAFAQSLRVDGYSDMFREQLARNNSEASRYLRQRRLELPDYDHKDGRIQSFLKSRDPWAYGVDDPSEDAYRKLLPQPETCMSDVIHQQAHTPPASDDPKK